MSCCKGGDRDWGQRRVGEAGRGTRGYLPFPVAGATRLAELQLQPLLSLLPCLTAGIWDCPNFRNCWWTVTAQLLLWSDLALGPPWLKALSLLCPWAACSSFQSKVGCPTLALHIRYGPYLFSAMKIKMQMPFLRPGKLSKAGRLCLRVARI